jgi:hypothetical protein
MLLDDRDGAFEWLDRAIEDRSYDITYINVDPLFDPVRDDPRFSALVRKLNLEPRKP